MADHKSEMHIVRSGKIKEQDDLLYIDDRGTALLLYDKKFPHVILWVLSIFVFVCMLWLYFAQIDKITRGKGRVISSLEIQYIQSYDGGIIREIYIDEGDLVKTGDKIIRIDDTDFRSQYVGSEIDINALSAKKYRLIAESMIQPFVIPETNNSRLYDKLVTEQKLYNAKLTTLKKKIEIIKEKILQKKSDIETLKIEIKTLQKALALSKETLDINKHMLGHKVLSKMKYNEYMKQHNDIEGDLEKKRSLLPKYKSEIKALEGEIIHAKLAFQSDARLELEEVSAKLDKAREEKKIDKGKIRRSLITTPITGVIKKMYYHTIGGVVKPGGIVAEIVPTEEHLIVDTKIAPSDIAFLYLGQSAVVRFSAYDFAVYGALKGKVISISADTTVDDIDKKHYYTVRIKTEKNYLTKNGSRLPIKIGMVATVDIMNGKQSVLDYLLNPIMEAKQNMLSNH